MDLVKGAWFDLYENTAYHDVIKLFKIYRAVNWQMQIKINQVKRRFHMEYGTDVDEFLDSIYQAGMDVERDLASEKERVEAINRSNQYLRSFQPESAFPHGWL